MQSLLDFFALWELLTFFGNNLFGGDQCLLRTRNTVQSSEFEIRLRVDPAEKYFNLD